MTQVEVDKMLRLCQESARVRRHRENSDARIHRRERPTVSDKASEIASNDAMPGRAFAFVKL